MNIVDILTLVNRIAFACCMICYIIYFIILSRINRQRNKVEEERKRDFNAMRNLSGDDYWKAYAEYKSKYLK